jgi:hypothetical protein
VARDIATGEFEVTVAATSPEESAGTLLVPPGWTTLAVVAGRAGGASANGLGCSNQNVKPANTSTLINTSARFWKEDFMKGVE